MAAEREEGLGFAEEPHVDLECAGRGKAWKGWKGRGGRGGGGESKSNLYFWSDERTLRSSPPVTRTPADLRPI